MASLKVLVCGGRRYQNYTRVSRVLDRLHAEHTIKLVIQGGANGADYLAKTWAQENKVPYLEHPANWLIHEKAAGPIRNREMLQWEPDLVVAFPGGTGTADMINVAMGAGIKVVRFEDE